MDVEEDAEACIMEVVEDGVLLYSLTLCLLDCLTVLCSDDSRTLSKEGRKKDACFCLWAIIVVQVMVMAASGQQWIAMHIQYG